MKGLFQSLFVSAALLGGSALADDKSKRERCDELAQKAEQAQRQGSQLSSNELAEWDRLCAPTVYRGEPHGDSATGAQVESQGEVWNTGSGAEKTPIIEESEATGGAGESGESDEGDTPTEQGTGE